MPDNHVGKETARNKQGQELVKNQRLKQHLDRAKTGKERA